MAESFDVPGGVTEDPDTLVGPVVSGEFVVYNTEDGRAEVRLRTVEGTVWLNQTVRRGSQGRGRYRQELPR